MAESVLITGVSSGLGYGLTKVYLEQGASVYGCSRRRPDALVREGLRFSAIDLRDPEGGAEALRGLVAAVGRLDTVILNAGKLGRIRDMRETPLDDLRETMEINVWANKWILDTVFNCVPSVRQVIGISSGASRSGSRGWNGYSLSKTALNMLIKLYAGERPETHFTALAPGLVDTAMQDYLTTEPDETKYPPVKKLKAAKGTAAMPDGEGCARMLIAAFPRLLEKPSGDFADIREL